MTAEHEPSLRLPACRSAPALLLAVLALTGGGGANAEVLPYYLGLTESYTRDTNLLRLADGAEAPAGFSRSDTSWSTALLAGFDQPFGRQHGYANLTLRDTRYSANSVYNYLGYSANAGLDWSTAERVSGTLAISGNRALYAFNAGYGSSLLTQKNLQTTKTVNGSVNVGLVTEYSLLFTAGRRDVTNSLDIASIQALDFSQDSASIGLQWRPRSSTTFGATYTEARGRYPRYRQVATGYEADRFRQPSFDFSAVVQPTGASNLELRLGYSQTRYDLNSPRNFSGGTGRLAWSWQPRSKLQLSARLTRDVGQNVYAVNDFGIAANSDYSQIYTVARLQADYSVTAKINLTTSVQQVRRTIALRTDSPFRSPTSEGKDTANVLAVGGRWAPLRSVLVGCDYSSEKRSASGELTSPLHDNTFACYAQFQLQQ
jgi:hypothetical protein